MTTSYRSLASAQDASPLNDVPASRNATLSGEPPPSFETPGSIAGPQHFLLSFFDRFLDERNIQWILVLGVLIVLTSSLLLVGWNWHETGYTPVAKYWTLIVYWGAAHLGARLCWRRLGLRKTATLLYSLSGLFVPVSFLALRWLEVAGMPWGAVLWGINLAGAAVVTRQSTSHLLGAGRASFAAQFPASRASAGENQHARWLGPEPAFSLSYLLLSLSWAIVPEQDWSNPWSALATAGALWLTFAVGSARINRHVFWLTEARQAPRVLALLPILTLGGLFWGLFEGYLTPHLSLACRGLGCVLTAIPVLLAADAAAAADPRRRPLPWPTALLLASGLFWCATGLVLACVELRPPLVIPPALVPTAAIAAGLLGLVARRTRQQAFVWAMLLTGMLAYNFSYVVCKDAVRAFLSQAASAISERRLPLAYYGLTYLPLLSVLIVAAVRAERRGATLFAGPLRRFAIGLTMLLLAASWSHPKALSPVGLALTAVLVAEARLFRMRGLAWVGSLAWLSACGGLAPFYEGVAGEVLPPTAWLACVTAGAFVLECLPTGPRLEPCRSSNVPMVSVQESLDSLNPCRAMGLVAALAGAFAWFLIPQVDWITGIGLGLLLVVQAWRARSEAIAVPAWCFLALATLRAGRSLGATQLLVGSELVLLTQWCVVRILPRLEPCQLAGVTRFRLTFAPVLDATSHVLLAGLLGLSVLVACFSGEPIFGWGPWLTFLAVCAWSFDAAGVRRSAWRTALGYVGLAVAIDLGERMSMGSGALVPTTWAVLAMLAQRLVEFLERQAKGREEWNAISVPLSYLAPLTLAVLTARACIDYSAAWRLAGAVAACGLARLACVHASLAVRRTAWGALNIFALAVVVQGVAALTATVAPASAASLTLDQLLAAAPPMALAAAASLFAWQRIDFQRTLPDEIARLIRVVLRTALGLAMHLALTAEAQPAGNLLLAGAALALAAAAEFRAACQRQAVERAWSAIALLGALAAFAARFGSLSLEAAMWLSMGGAVAMRLASRICGRHSVARILAGPLAQSADALPLLAIGAALLRHAMQAPTWLGWNSLAVLSAAGFYFAKALEQQDRRHWLLPAGIVNVSLALLWRELAWNDPQFYMVPLGATMLALVEVLLPQIPPQLHNPLRYVGALTILVSPTFHIVEGSWLHLIALMVVSLAVVLASIAVQVRATLYLGTGFLMADLAAMLARGSIDRPNLLWLAGLAIGAGVLTLGAVCENHRERVLERVRHLSAALETWK